MTWTEIWATSVNAWLYGFFGALAGALVTWLLGRKLWKHLVAMIRDRTAATHRVADATAAAAAYQRADQHLAVAEKLEQQFDLSSAQARGARTDAEHYRTLGDRLLERSRS